MRKSSRLLPVDARKMLPRPLKRTGYTRDPFDCKKCRVEHDVSPFHNGPDPAANCGKRIADAVLKDMRDGFDVET
jgi:hypothetical protein